MSAAEPEVLVEVHGVSKKFTRDLRRSLVYGLKDILGFIGGRRSSKGALRKSEFWALKDISFTVRRGECIGLIGHNGAGKSTLLKVLNGLITPDEGSVVMRGKVGALIELGAGFNPLLTGRENIYINGQLLGFSRKEIDAKLGAILAFADIGEFIDAPVQNYSSGMKVRLGFAVAAQMEPDVLIIDEVLAVGDLGFVLKCFNSIDQLLQNTAVIFVSHNMPQVSRICTDILMLDKGKTVHLSNDVARGIDQYYARFKTAEATNVVFNRDNDAQLEHFSFGGQTTAADAMHSIRHLDDLHLNIHLRIRDSLKSPYLSVVVHDKEQRPIGLCLTKTSLSEGFLASNADGYNLYKVSILLPRMNLSKGLYSVGITVTEDYNSLPMLRVHGIGMFQMLSEADIWPPVEFEAHWSKAT